MVVTVMVVSMVMVPIILSDASNMVVVSHLRQPHGLFKPRQPDPVLAEFAVHIRTALHRLL